MLSLSNLRRASPQPVLVRAGANIPFDYQLQRSRRKTMAVHVRHQSVEVRVPLFVGQAQIEEFVLRHREWIQKKLAHKAEQDNELLRIVHGASIFYKARECILVFTEAADEGVRIRGREVQIRGRRLNEKRAGRILSRWLQQQARDYLPQRTRALVQHLGLSAKFADVAFRKTRSKWGHCTAEGRIQYNWLIMLAPNAIIDYMICHEVCHLIHMNHSRHYWQEVERLCPDYRSYVKWLKTHEHRLWF